MDVEADSTFTNTKTSTNYAKFYPMWKRNNAKSDLEQKEVGEWIDMVMIVAPGQNKDEFHGKATPEIQREYPDQWRAYKEGREQRITGMPLELLPGLDKNRVDMYKAGYVHTIEQLAGMSDISKQKFGMGTSDDVKKAQVFLGQNSGELMKVKQENEELRQKLAELSEKVAALAPKKRGRPKKETVTE